MNYLVTGGAGFIGSHVCDALVERGDRVVCVDNFNDFYDPKVKRANIEPLLDTTALFRLEECDITNLVGLSEVFEKYKPDTILHLAARAGVRPSLRQPKLYWETNLQGTWNLLELARSQGVKNFVFASSSSVYGERAEGPFRETDSVDKPISPYAATKRAGEILCGSYAQAYNIPVTCLRFFTVVGARQRPDLAAHKFMLRMMNCQPIEVFGDGSTERDYTCSDDIARGVLAAADKPLPYEIVNLGNSSPVSLNEFIELIEDVVGNSARRVQKPLQQGDVSRTYADVSKAKELYGWEPKTQLKRGLEELHKYLVQRELGC